MSIKNEYFNIALQNMPPATLYSFAVVFEGTTFVSALIDKFQAPTPTQLSVQVPFQGSGIKVPTVKHTEGQTSFTIIETQTSAVRYELLRTLIRTNASNTVDIWVIPKNGIIPGPFIFFKNCFIINPGSMNFDMSTPTQVQRFDVQIQYNGIEMPFGPQDTPLASFALRQAQTLASKAANAIIK